MLNIYSCLYKLELNYMTHVSVKHHATGSSDPTYRSRAREVRREIERETRRQQPKRARPKTAKGFALTPQNSEAK